jgi:hypothetical protein
VETLLARNFSSNEQNSKNWLMASGSGHVSED